MDVFEHWQTQKEVLQTALSQCKETADIVYRVRHAILQTEQNALAEIKDDVLRQQASVLFGCVKNTISLLGIQANAQVWVPSKRTLRFSNVPLWGAGGILLLLLGAVCYATGFWFGMILCVAVLLCAVTALWQCKRAALSSAEDTRVTYHFDTNQLLSVLDGQIRSIDRCLNDFIFLNDQLRGNAECTDPAALSYAAELLEALLECDMEQRLAAEEAAKRLLENLGMQAVDYCKENQRLFNVLPSKDTTTTLCPAILSIKDRRLLHRGTAAVKIDIAQPE